jgi:hypothetical protein
MPATMTTVNSITKEIYQGQIQDQLQNEVVGIKRIEKTSRGVTNEVGGKYVTFPVRVRRNHGIGYRNEYETLQAGSQQGYASVRTGLKFGYGRVEVTGQTMELAKTNYQAFANAMNLEMTGLKNDIAKDVNRIFYGDGSGFLCTSTTNPASGNVLTVDSVQYLEIGMIVDVVNSSGAVQGAAGRLITAINTSAKTVTVDGAAFDADLGWGLVRTGNTFAGGSGTPAQREPTGLRRIVNNTGALFNIDPASEPTWAAVVDANGGTNRALTEALMIRQTDNVRVNGGNTSLILAGLGVRRAYFNLLTQQRRYTETKEYPGGITGLSFHNGRDIPMVDDVDTPANQMFFLDESSLTIYRNSDWSWLDADGSIWKWVSNKDAFEAILACYWELGVNRRNANAVLRDITEG